MTEVVLIAAAYLAGSLPFGYWLVRIFRHADIRTLGSKNTGMTNVWRNFGWRFGVATLLLDVAKGAAAVLIADRLFGQGLAIFAGLGAFLGHIFPVWLKFKGGKGVATYLGVLLGSVWQAGAVFVLLWLAIAAITRISSLAAIIATLAAPIAVYAWGSRDVALIAALMSLIILMKHRGNIRRLMTGREPRIGAKA